MYEGCRGISANSILEANAAHPSWDGARKHSEKEEKGEYA
jgi:hypothetical protein